MTPPRVSIGTWAFIRGGHAHDPVPLAAVVAHAQRLHFDGVELAGFGIHMDPRDFPTQGRRREVKRLLEDHGLRVSGLASDLSRVPPSTARPPDYLEALARYLDICHDLETPNLRIDSGSPSMAVPGGLDLETCFWRTAQTWQRAAAVAAREGIRLVWEFEAAFLFNKPSEVVRMVHAVDHPSFLALYDVYHAFTCGVLGLRQMGPREVLPGGAAQFAHMLTGKIGLAHLSGCERRVQDDGTVTGARALFGQGVVDLDAVARAVLEAGYAGEWWTIDLGGFWPDAWRDTASAKAGLDALLRGLGGDGDPRGGAPRAHGGG